MSALRESARVLNAALDSPDLIARPVRLRAFRQSRLLAHLDADPPFITLDGKPCPPFDEGSTRFVAMLIDADGYRVGYPDFLKVHPDDDAGSATRAIDKAPEVIRSYIDSHRGIGTRLRVEDLQ